jgi:exosortase
MMMRARTAALAVTGLLLLSFGLLYRDVLVKLVHDWLHDDNYSHGVLIVPIALYFAWERRERLLAAPAKPSILGLVVVFGSVLLLMAGTLGAELFLSRVSIIGIVAGTVLFVLGWEHLKILLLPIAFLVLMIPIPAIIFNQIAFPLQLLASRFGEATLRALSIPVLREGNVITLATTQLEVAEACSGIRSLISLLTLGIVYGYFVTPSVAVRTVLALATIPVAILANGLRVAGTGIAAHYYGPSAAEGFFHTFSGWLVFVVSFAMLFLIHRLIARWASPPAIMPPPVKMKEVA